MQHGIGILDREINDSWNLGTTKWTWRTSTDVPGKLGSIHGASGTCQAVYLHVKANMGAEKCRCTWPHALVGTLWGLDQDLVGFCRGCAWKEKQGLLNWCRKVRDMQNKPITHQTNIFHSLVPLRTWFMTCLCLLLDGSKLALASMTDRYIYQGLPWTKCRCWKT